MLKIWDNGYDSVIAESEDDARAVILELCGPMDEIDGDGWTVYADDEDFTLLDLDAPVPLGQEPPKITMKAGEWVAKHGRCYLGSTEY